MFVKPAPGRLVRDPVSKRPLPAEGAEVPENTYWIRRLACGDVISCDVPARVVSPQQIPDSGFTSEK